MVHHLTGKDPATRSATCSVCGPVRMARVGAYWQCGRRKAQRDALWRRRNPRRSGRDAPSAHRLSQRDVESRTGVCPVDGVVEIVPFGRGWACKVRADELRSRHEEEPQRACRVCRSDGVVTWLRSDGSCPRCLDGTDLGAVLRAWRDGRRMGVPEGFHVVSDAVDPYWMPEDESAVPGWRTIGSGRLVAAREG